MLGLFEKLNSKIISQKVDTLMYQKVLQNQ